MNKGEKRAGGKRYEVRLRKEKVEEKMMRLKKGIGCGLKLR